MCYTGNDMALWPEPEIPGQPNWKRRLGDCPCGGPHERFIYRRGVLPGNERKGFWYCGDCGSRVSPAIGGVFSFSEAEKKRLNNLKVLYSIEGWGDLFGQTGELACAFPRGSFAVVPAP